MIGIQTRLDVKMPLEEFKHYLEDYRREKKQGEFQGDWLGSRSSSFQRGICCVDYQTHLYRFRYVLLGSPKHGIFGFTCLAKPVIVGFQGNFGLLLFGAAKPMEKLKTPRFAIILWYAGGHYQPLGVQYPEGKKTIWTP